MEEDEAHGCSASVRAARLARDQLPVCCLCFVEATAVGKRIGPADTGLGTRTAEPFSPVERAKLLVRRPSMPRTVPRSICGPAEIAEHPRPLQVGERIVATDGDGPSAAASASSCRPRQPVEHDTPVVVRLGEVRVPLDHRIEGAERLGGPALHQVEVAEEVPRRRVEQHGVAARGQHPDRLVVRAALGMRHRAL